MSSSSSIALVRKVFKTKFQHTRHLNKCFMFNHKRAELEVNASMEEFGRDIYNASYHVYKHKKKRSWSVTVNQKRLCNCYAVTDHTSHLAVCSRNAL